MNRYQEGALVRVSGAFTDLNGNPQDPTTVTLKIQDPNGTINTYVYPTGVTKDSVGNYHRDVDTTTGTPSTIGTWTYEWKATGTGQAASAGQFYVYDLLTG